MEFIPVFSAFERMDADLAASREALEEAQRRTESVLRDVASGVIAVDRDGLVMLANPGADALLGRPITPGMTLRQLGETGLAARAEAFLAGTNSEDAFDETVGGRQLRGSLAHLERGTGGAVLTLEDVTELARAQRVLAWGEMARQVAHEIKNPLTPIRLGVQHLRRARVDSRVDFGRIFEQNVERILAEIERLDEIARLQPLRDEPAAARSRSPRRRCDHAGRGRSRTDGRRRRGLACVSARQPGHGTRPRR
jgi:nitrogen fixation/metabolism regulation signal transduction histidine kinase